MQKLFENFRIFLNEAPTDLPGQDALDALKNKMEANPQQYLETFEGDVLDLTRDPNKIGLDSWIEDGWKYWPKGAKFNFKWYAGPKGIEFVFQSILDTAKSPDGRGIKDLSFTEKKQAEAYLKERFERWRRKNGAYADAGKKQKEFADKLQDKFFDNLEYGKGHIGRQLAPHRYVLHALSKELKRSQWAYYSNILDFAVEEWFKHLNIHRERRGIGRTSSTKKPALAYAMREWLFNTIILSMPYSEKTIRLMAKNSRDIAQDIARYYSIEIENPKRVRKDVSDVASRLKAPSPRKPRFVPVVHGDAMADLFHSLNKLDDTEHFSPSLIMDPEKAMAVGTREQGVEILPEKFWKRISDEQVNIEKIVAQVTRDPEKYLELYISKATNDPIISKASRVGWERLQPLERKLVRNRLVSLVLVRNFNLMGKKKPIIKNIELLDDMVESWEELSNMRLDLEDLSEQGSREMTVANKKPDKNWFKRTLRKIPFFSTFFATALFPYDEAYAAYIRGLERKAGIREEWDGTTSMTVGGAVQTLAGMPLVALGDSQAELHSLILLEIARSFDPGVELTELIMILAKKYGSEVGEWLMKGRRYLGPSKEDIEDYPELDQTPSWAHGDKGEKEEIGPVPQDLQEMKMIFENWRKWK